MRNIKLRIEYDGTDFNGWQIQQKGTRTVQQEIEKALQIILKKKIRIYGSGRTDSGVHAAGQIAHLKTQSTIPSDALCRALNTHLPPDIVIHDVQDVPLNFHAQFSAQRKIYQYTILNRQSPCALNRRFCTHIPYRLNIKSMRTAASMLIGTHDFRSFVASDSARKKNARVQNTVRTIYQSTLKKRGDYLIYTIESNGFLYKMVRNIIGTLMAVGCAQLPADGIPHIIHSKDRSAAGYTAPPQGLCLMEVKYDM